jgi:CoA:oxalate CoA-transferase
MTRPLQDLRVIDLTQGLAGPYCTEQLASMGAEVFHIEPPWGGYGATLFKADEKDFERILHGTTLRNKKNLTLNLRHEKGKEILTELVKKGDVVVQNFSPGTMEKLGFGYDVLKEINPRIIYCAISGFGQTGPWRNRVSYDMIAQAATGLMSITGYPDRPPLRVGTAISDILGGIFGALGILYALHARDSITGKGQMIDCSMFDATLSVIRESVALSLSRGKALERSGNHHPLMAPSGAYRTKDGKLELIVCQTDAQWEAIMTLVGGKDILEKKWKLVERAKHADEIDDIVEKWTKTKTRDEIEAISIEHHVPCAPVMDLIEVEKHPHTKAREMFVEVDDMYGRISGILGIVPKLSDTPGGSDWGLMERGAFNEEVYASLLGFSEEKIKGLREDGVI